MAAMTCPGVPTHRKRLRPAERVETESAYIGSLPSVEDGRRQNAIGNLSCCEQSRQADQERGALAYRNGTS